MPNTDSYERSPIQIQEFQPCSTIKQQYGTLEERYVKHLPVDVTVEAAEVVLFGHIQDGLQPGLPGLLLLGQSLLFHLLPVGRGHELLLVRELVSLRLPLFLDLRADRKLNCTVEERISEAATKKSANMIVCLYKLFRGFM
jgi:hypothetical protein